MAPSHDDVVGFGLALGIVLGTVALAHVLPAATSAPQPSKPVPFELGPTCAEWTDGCIVCQRTEQGLACSMPGIACQPREQQCLRRAGA
jgi:hypothetical protein